MRQTRNIDALAENGIVEDDELFVIITTPFSQSFEEHIARDFGVIDISTVLRCDVQDIITALTQTFNNVAVAKHTPQHTGVRCSNENFSRLLLIEILNDIENNITIYIMCIVLSANMFCLMHNKLRRNDATILYKFWCRYGHESITEHDAIVHATSIRIARILRSGSKEERIICAGRSSSNTNKVLLTGSIVCLITVQNIDIDATINNTRERVIGSEDQLMNTSSLADNIVRLNVFDFSSTIAVNIATMHMHSSTMYITIEILKELAVELHCEKNTRSDYNNCLRFVGRLQSTLAIFHHDDSFAAASRNIDATFLCVAENIESTGLVGAELNHAVCRL